MSLLQISDPKQTKDKLKKFVVGIDLGTTNSLIAMRNTTTKFYIENKSTMIPSIVNFHPDGRIIIGKSSISDVFLGNDAGEVSIGENENFSVASIKRLIGLPGDKIQFIDGFLYLNNNKILRDKINFPQKINCGNSQIEVDSYIETLPDGKTYTAVYRKRGTMLNSDEYIVPNGYYFFLGDNRDCSKDSRYLTDVGYVKAENLVGQAKILFFSNNVDKGNFFQFWKWKKSIRLNRFFNKIK